MKKTLLALALVAPFAASAEEVTVTAYGKDFDSALISAKKQAVDQVNGAWIRSQSRTDGNTVQEDITKYSGGVLKNYKILSWDGEQIVIQADVEPHKDNRVVSNSSKIDKEMKNHLEQLERDQKKLRKAMDHLGDKKEAFKVVPQNIEYHPTGNGTTIIHVYAKVVWDTKWVSDTKSLAQTVDREGLTSHGMHNKIVGGVTNALITNGHPFVGAILGSATWKQEKTKSSPMICFGEKQSSIAKECYDTGMVPNFGYNMSIKMSGVDEMGNPVFSAVHNTSAKKLYENIAPNTVKQHHSFRTLDMKYLQPTFAIYEKEGYTIKYGFEISSEKLGKVDKFVYEVK